MIARTEALLRNDEAFVAEQLGPDRGYFEHLSEREHAAMQEVCKLHPGVAGA